MCGVAMRALYFMMLIAACSLNPDFDPLRQEPSELGRAVAVCPLVYNSGMVATALAGMFASIGLLKASRRMRRGLRWCAGAGLSTFFGSAGLAMAGFFPLPSHLHYAFGLTIAAVVTPLFGAVSMWRSFHRFTAATLILGFIAVAGSVAETSSPLLSGSLIFALIAWLCLSILRDLKGVEDA